MKSLVIISKYPDSETVKDGMYQRIKNIDNEISKFNRIYLDVSYKKNLILKEKIEGNLRVISLNYFKHRKIIKQILKESDKIYIHTIYNYFKVMKYINKSNGKKSIIDLHGVVPNELHFMNKKISAKIFEKIEHRALKNVNKVICVTNSMKNFYCNKYRIDNCIVYPIYTNNVFKNIDIKKENKLKKELNIKEDDIVFIYSGNCQKWQNVNEMISLIETLNNEKFKFLILTGEKNKFKEKIREKNLHNKIYLTSVSPENLRLYYSISNYGFILRDEHILNKVACPTKLIEYMYYGIIPIVKLEEIGDFKELGYEYVKSKNVNDNLCKKKSSINYEIVKKMFDNSKENTIENIIY